MTPSFRRAAVALATVVPIVVWVAPASAQAPNGGSWRGGGAPDTPIRTTTLPPSMVAPASQIGDLYLKRAQTDRANAELWVFCAAAALKRSIATDDEADAYGRDIAATLKAIVGDSARSPCEDAIPAAVWGERQALSVDSFGTDDIVTSDPAALTPAEEERQRRINAEADAQERARAEAQAAALQRRQETQARYDRERAQYETDVAASKAADANYQRRLEERRRLIESGQYREPQ